MPFVLSLPDIMFMITRTLITYNPCSTAICLVPQINAIKQQDKESFWIHGLVLNSAYMLFHILQKYYSTKGPWGSVVVKVLCY
jgi:hypothetical protein